MTPEQWDTFFEIGHPMKRMKQLVSVECRRHLINLMPGMNISTTDLINHLYPEELVKHSKVAFDNRKKLFIIIYQLANDQLSDCCIKGPVDGQFMGKPKRPWLWFCPVETDVCGKCGQPLPPELEG